MITASVVKPEAVFRAQIVILAPDRIVPKYPGIETLLLRISRDLPVPDKSTILTKTAS